MKGRTEDNADVEVKAVIQGAGEEKNFQRDEEDETQHNKGESVKDERGEDQEVHEIGQQVNDEMVMEKRTRTVWPKKRTRMSQKRPIRRTTKCRRYTRFARANYRAAFQARARRMASASKFTLWVVQHLLFA